MTTYNFGDAAGNIAEVGTCLSGEISSRIVFDNPIQVASDELLSITVENGKVVSAAKVKSEE